MKKHAFYLLLLLFISFFLFHQPVYAAEEYHYPTDTFSTNVSGVYKVNYIRMSYVSLSMTAPFINEFVVPTNYKTRDGVYPLYLLSKNLEIPTIEDKVELGSNNPTIPEDSGITYILMHGYGIDKASESIFSEVDYGSIDDTTKQYITQIALWLYIYQNKEKFADTYCQNEACYFHNNSGKVVPYEDVLDLVERAGMIQNYSYLKYIPLLVNNAHKYVKEEISLSEIDLSEVKYHFNEDNTQLVTDSIQPTASSSPYLYYQVSLEDPNQYGAYIVDEEGQVIHPEDKITKPFKVIVPLLENIEEMNLKTISVKVQAAFKHNKVYEYHVTSASLNTNYSHLLFGFVSANEVVTSTFQLYNFVRIATVNPFNFPLSGNTMILRNKNNPQEIQTIISTDSPHSLSLEDGDYLLCEEDGDTCVSFVVDDSRVVYLREDDELVNVPDTAMFQSKFFYYFGAFSILLGGVFMGSILFKKNKTNH